MVQKPRDARSGEDSQGERVDPHRHEPTASGHTMRLSTLVIGLGNPLITDDRVGLRVVKQLEPLLADRTDVVLTEDYWGGLRLMERMIDYDRAIVIDAICTGAEPGTLHLLSTDSVPTQKSASAHDVNLPTALAFGRQAGAHLPADDHIQLVGIEAEDILTFSDECTPAVAAAIPQAVEMVLELLQKPPGDFAI
ncbi:MAG: hydrogenase maturation protease [Pirellulaceae bacterium]